MDGILIVDKPVGWTSHDVVARVRRLLKTKRVGHTGTLDPFATGVLIVLVGRATRLAQFLVNSEKEYEAVIRFGYTTDTGDGTGERLKTTPFVKAWSEDEIERALAGLRGRIEQVPPMYSAKKVKGQKLYELARRGEEIERQPIPIHIYELEAQTSNGTLLQTNTDGTIDLNARVRCSAGTYVRVLAEMTGERLGAGAHLAHLRRTRAGSFRIEDAVTLDELQKIVEADDTERIIISSDAALSHMPFVHLTAGQTR
ncbi:MAG: tRNA pseudouridine(55) synthase TruB, partial [Pyrinomonadaceae bacterium]|nr:tRNA pseudouridine(55) synthase TruB [Pyrinomonadaceae bacterium]